MFAIWGSSCNFSAKQGFIEHCHDVSMRVIAGCCHVLCIWILFFYAAGFVQGRYSRVERSCGGGGLLGALVAILFSLIAGFPLLNSKDR